jgi:hypothetical protein
MDLCTPAAVFKMYNSVSNFSIYFLSLSLSLSVSRLTLFLELFPLDLDSKRVFEKQSGNTRRVWWYDTTYGGRKGRESLLGTAKI